MIMGSFTMPNLKKYKPLGLGSDLSPTTGQKLY